MPSFLAPLCNVADAQPPSSAQATAGGVGGAGPAIGGQPAVAGPTPAGTPGMTRPRPGRFYAKVTLDPNRPTPQVSNIAQSILSELDRAHDTTITLTLDIDAETADASPRMSRTSCAITPRACGSRILGLKVS